MKFKNPVILCDYSDPDVCRAGDDFYLTASSFNFVPGLPVLHSKDLVHWNLINYAAKTIPIPGYDKVQNAKGLWAPSIRFYNEKFYIFVATPDEGIFYTCTENPYGEWSELSCVWSGRGFEDPCPFWEKDENGAEHLYVVHAYVKSRIGFNSKLGIFELDPETFKPISEDKIIFDGTKTQPTIEGPKLYKRNGFYYIFAPAGGVTNGWQTVLRSKSLYGNYEEKIVLAQGNSKINGPHQGGWVETKEGENWFIHFQDAGIFGRIDHMQPVRWVNDWPVMGNAVLLDDEKALNVIGEPVEKWQAPNINVLQGCSKNEKREKSVYRQVNRFFSCERKLQEEISVQKFQTSGNPGEKFYASSKKSLWLTPSVCTKKLDSKKITYEKEFSLDGKWNENERRGIIFLGNEYAALQIEKIGNTEFKVSYLESSGSESGDEERNENIIWSKTIYTPLENEKLPFESGNSGKNFQFAECIGGSNFSNLGIFQDKDSKIKFKLKFRASKDGKSGEVRFSVKANIFGQKISFKSKVFSTVNAHWVGGRFGWF